MTDGAVGTAEFAAGETELRELDRAFGSAVAWAVVVDLDEFEVVEDVPVQIECRGGGTVLKGQEGSEPLGHGIDASILAFPSPSPPL